jgi:hypothetical protein
VTKTRLLLPALLILASAAAGSLSEKLVFQGNPTPPNYGFDLSDEPGHLECPDPYTDEDCIYANNGALGNDYLGETLAGDKHAYRVKFSLYAAADSAQSKFRCVLSFRVGPANADAEGDGYHTEAFGESVGVVFEENPVGWDIKLVEVEGESYQELAIGTESRTSSAWRSYDFIVDSDNQQAKLLNDQGSVVVSHELRHHEGKPIQSQWYRFTGGASLFTAGMFLRVKADSTAIYDQDPRAPTITDLQQTPRLVAAGQEVKITATIRDDWGRATAVLRQWVNGQGGPDLAMTYSGSTYTATLPGRANDAEVRYQVEATGVSGLKAVSDTIQYTVGSNEDPDNLGGGTGSGKLEPGLLGAVAISGALVVVGFILFIALREQDPRLAKFILVGAAGLAIVAFPVILYLDAIAKALANPYLLPVLLMVAAVAAVAIVVVRQGRRKGVEK